MNVSAMSWWFKSCGLNRKVNYKMCSAVIPHCRTSIKMHRFRQFLFRVYYMPTEVTTAQVCSSAFHHGTEWHLLKKFSDTNLYKTYVVFLLSTTCTHMLHCHITKVRLLCTVGLSEINLSTQHSKTYISNTLVWLKPDAIAPLVCLFGKSVNAAIQTLASNKQADQDTQNESLPYTNEVWCSLMKYEHEPNASHNVSHDDHKKRQNAQAYLFFFIIVTVLPIQFNKGIRKNFSMQWRNSCCCFDLVMHCISEYNQMYKNRLIYYCFITVKVHLLWIFKTQL